MVVVYHKNGPIEYKEFSNFYPCTVVYQRTVFQSSEQAYQWAKAATSEDRARVERTANGAAAKKVGKAITKRPRWNQVKIQVMRDVLLCKFVQNEVLADLLVGTGTHPIVELAPWGDKFWGCDSAGQNQLGLALEAVREILRAERALFG